MFLERPIIHHFDIELSWLKSLAICHSYHLDFHKITSNFTLSTFLVHKNMVTSRYIHYKGPYMKYIYNQGSAVEPKRNLFQPRWWHFRRRTAAKVAIDGIVSVHLCHFYHLKGSTVITISEHLKGRFIDSDIAPSEKAPSEDHREGLQRQLLRTFIVGLCSLNWKVQVQVLLCFRTCLHQDWCRSPKRTSTVHKVLWLSAPPLDVTRGSQRVNGVVVHPTWLTVRTKWCIVAPCPQVVNKKLN